MKPPIALLATTALITVLGSMTLGLASLAQSDSRLSTLSLRDIAQYYSGLPHQDRALSLLQSQLEATDPSLLQSDSIVGNIWRNNNSFTGHVDMLSRIPAAQRVGSDPITLIMEYAKWSDEGGNPFNIQLLQGPDNQVIATVDRGGLRDDSVSDIRYRFDIQRQANGQWEIKKAGQQYRCQPGRGQQDWAGTLCS
jgi:hypothetical protein